MVYNTSQPPAEQREEKVKEGSKDSSREEVFQTIKVGILFTKNYPLFDYSVFLGELNDRRAKVASHTALGS
jgi:hypothetical protein